jgi:hypothetical protein
MDRIRIEQQLAMFSIVTIAKPNEQEIEELKIHFDVTDLGNNQITIKYK